MTGGEISALGSKVVPLSLFVAALWGASDFLGGFAARRAPALLVVSLSHGLSMTLLVLIAVAGHAYLPSEHTAMWAVVNGVCGCLALIVFYQALAAGEMGMSAALAGLLTALVPVVFSWITEGRPKPTQIAGFVIASFAIYLIANEPSHTAREGTRPKALGLTVLAGLGFGAFLVTSKLASRDALLWPLAISRVTSASLATGILLAISARRRFTVPDGQNTVSLTSYIRPVLLLAGAAGILESAGNLLYMVGTLAGRLDIVSVLSSFYPAGTILLAVWLLKERTTRTRALGMALAMVAIAMISL